MKLFSLKLVLIAAVALSAILAQIYGVPHWRGGGTCLVLKPGAPELRTMLELC